MFALMDSLIKNNAQKPCNQLAYCKQLHGEQHGLLVGWNDWFSFRPDQCFTSKLPNNIGH
jgi:hypothetical protein